ncbi:hypothetical protein LG204_00025 [Methylovorus menthalis]|uniref:hypothetical protein n=1 Tax=Methylovorus menthalis TaxID=1002227 RepID=UPI001E64C16D|nr:hypothetical protein [Methylovorus menthalis]MCB4809702.1 hypothetical protein [Methylovorus menthalis]
MNTIKKYGKQYIGVKNILKKYWRIYGGCNALIGSPYLHLSLLLTAISSHYWIYTENWFDLPTSVLPNLIGFTLAGLAIFLSFGNDQYQNLITGKFPDEDSNRNSPYLGFSVTFLHFVLVQIVALLFALITKSLQFPFPFGVEFYNNYFKYFVIAANGIGYWIFLYSICIGIAAVFSIFRLICSFDEYATLERERLLQIESESNAKNISKNDDIKLKN